jgi:CRP-like cAMP-binding protein
MRTIDTTSSLILASLSPLELDNIDDDLERVRLEAGKTIVAAHEPIRRVYFPDSGLIALSLMLPDGRTAGVTLVGDEGIVGLSAAIAVPANTDAVVQVGGYARAMAAPRCGRAKPSEP